MSTNWTVTCQLLIRVIVCIGRLANVFVKVPKPVAPPPVHSGTGVSVKEECEVEPEAPSASPHTDVRVTNKSEASSARGTIIKEEPKEPLLRPPGMPPMNQPQAQTGRIKKQRIA